MGFVIKNAQVLNENFNFQKVDVEIEGQFISNIKANINSQTFVDAQGYYLIPGLIDIHIHGCSGCDFCDGEISSLQTISHYLASNGITSFLGTSMSLPEEELEKIFKVAHSFIKENTQGAYMQGIYMEGPFFSKNKKGAQGEEHLRDPDIQLFNRLYDISGGNIKVCAFAPELNNSEEFIKEIKNKGVLSIAHSEADYDTALKGINLGISSITHLYNAMTPFNHRSPGIIGAAFDSNVFVELICDGIHVHPSVIRSTYKIVGSDRVILVSDSMAACGMADGQYTLGGQNVIVKKGKATLEDGTIAGSTTNLMDCVKKCHQFGIPLEHAIKSASINPAKLLGAADMTGSISIGKYGDLVLLDKNLNVKGVYIKGKKFI
ncbi:N-acetylglucosamine-6-phosphate deacetylase [Anaerobranca californiensis DSM 14826]|jgi:N-acetylglucosamine-6-phosphate deacetylase|uniref:N-acetylglucosamine-6-phosphate deacetylase n=1 Tax=Anaerobranca californiensis DSM 14826 TaxID=1120989 RepID=A0A1M6R269_9FIRM|nr:N-acetylglucosamine-6-phosphate deacetylase [Anaerobranca californiensis]SHK26490.1 N-acetylglucosamine-6-phosphate deacetylase [Anaerobranca californiensis DSM 14826]